MPAITTNYELLLTYEDKQPIQSPCILTLNTYDAKEHAAQVIAMETLRHLKSLLITVQQYNDMTAEAWAAVVASGVDRASYHPSARVDLLSASEKENAANTGGNFFEHGYVTVMAGVQNDNKITFGYAGPG